MSLQQKNSDIRCAIIGCGPSTAGRGGAHSIAYAHAAAMRDTLGLKLVAAASRTSKNIVDFCEFFNGCAPYQDHVEMLKIQRPEWVVISAFPPDREMMVENAIEHGAKVVLIEKPMAICHHSARRMIALAQRKGVRLFVHHQRRYGTPFLQWAGDVQNQSIGELQSISIVQPFPPFIDFGPHLLDAALFALGERRAQSVWASSQRVSSREYQGVATEDQLMATVRFDDGVALKIEVVTTKPQKQPILRADASAGFSELWLEPQSGESGIYRTMTTEGLRVPLSNEHFHHSEDPNLFIDRAYQDMLMCYRGGLPCRLDVEHAYRGLEMMSGIFQACERHERVDFPLD